MTWRSCATREEGFEVRRMLPHGWRVRDTVLATYGVLLVGNWMLGPRLYPEFRIAVTSALIIVMVADLLVFWTLESIRRRLRNRRRTNAA